MSWGIYVHVPYCASICPYCDFNVHRAADPPWAELLAALRRELRARRPAWPAAAATTLYFGGGTPSLAPAWFVAGVVDAARAEAGLADGAEITLEANPGGLGAARLAGYVGAGVRRLSLGWQSTHARLLRVLGRDHGPEAGPAVVALARAAGIASVSLDLIFAVPGQSLGDLDGDLSALLALAPEHVSLYALTYKPGTPFHRRRARGSLSPASEALELQMMGHIQARLCAADFEHYEVSNYARSGHTSRHNALYWQGGEYLGLGPGAHSFCHSRWQRGWRWENARAPAAYLAAWQTPRAGGRPAAGDDSVAACETLSARQLLCERLMCAMRQPSGIDITAPPCAGHAHAIAPGIAAARARGWAELADGRLRPSAAGLVQADALAELFF